MNLKLPFNNMNKKPVLRLAAIVWLGTICSLMPAPLAHAQTNCECCPLGLPVAPNNFIDFTLNWAYPPTVSDSFLTATVFTNGAVAPGIYASWCADAQTDLLPGIQGFGYSGSVYTSTDPTLNQFLQLVTDNTDALVSPAVWHYVNYILSHRAEYNYWDVQGAIWHFVGGPAVATPPYPYFNQAAVSQMVSNAIINAPAWCPQLGDKVAVVIALTWPQDNQIIVIEMPCPGTIPGLAVSVNCPTDCGLVGYSGSVSNTGNVTLTNVFVLSSQPSDHTAVLGPLSLAPGAAAVFAGFYVNPCVTNLSTNTFGVVTTNIVTVVVTNSATILLTNSVGVVTTNTVPVITTNTLGVITTNIVSVVTTNQVPMITTNLVSFVLTNTVGVVTTNMVSVVLTNTVTVLLTNTVGVVTTNAVSVITTNTLDVFATNIVSVVTTNQVPMITTNLVSFVLTNTVGVVTTNMVSVVLTNTVTVLLTNNVGVVTTNAVSVITTNTLYVFATNIVSVVTTNQVPMITTNLVSFVLTNTVGVVTTNMVSVVLTNTVDVVTTNTVLVFTTNNTVVITTNNAVAASSNTIATTFGTISPAGSIATVTDRFVVGTDFYGLTYSDSDHGYAATKFYSIHHDAGANANFFDTIAPTGSTGTITDRFTLPQYNFDALTYAAPDVGYGPIIFYYLRHDTNCLSVFGSVTPGGVVGVTTDHKTVGTNFVALTFSATDVGYGANLFYYVRHDENCNYIFGTIDPAQGGPVTDRFNIGANVDALVFTATDVGYGAANFYYLRHDNVGNSTFGTIFVTGLTSGNVTDRFGVGTNVTELTFTTTDVLYGPNLFYYLRGTPKAGCAQTTFTTNTATTFTTNAVTSLSTNTVTSFSTNTVTSFSTNNVTSFSTNTVTSFSTNTMTSFSTNNVTSFSTNNVTNFSTNTVTSFSTNTVTSFSTNTVTSFTTNTVTSCSTNNVTSFSTNNVTSFSTNNVTNFSTNTVTSFSTNTVISFSTNTVTSFSTNDITQFTTNNVTSFSTNYITQFTTNTVMSFGTNIVAGAITNTVTAHGSDVCQGRTVTALATCSVSGNQLAALVIGDGGVPPPHLSNGTFTWSFMTQDQM